MASLNDYTTIDNKDKHGSVNSEVFFSRCRPRKFI